MTTPNKQLGQHWLNDVASLEAIVKAAIVQPSDTILEIGPGLGSLTQILINSGAAITAVELDANLVIKLRKRFKDFNDQLTIIGQDIMRFNFGHLPKDYKIVANIPYYLTAGLIRLITENNNQPSIATLLVQKEVAERIAAKPGQMSILAVITQLYFEVALGDIVPAKLFTPPPKVNSRIIVLTRRPKPLFHHQDSKLLFSLIKAGFSSRRKKLRSSLSGGLGLTKKQIDQYLQLADIDGNLRAQNLTLDDWLRLLKYWPIAKLI